MRGLFTQPWVFAAISVFSHATPQNLEAQKAAAHNVALLIVGAFFPALSWLTGVASHVAWRRHKKYSSPAFVPFVGPIVLTGWVLSAHKPLWAIPLVWLCDLGTMYVLWFIPRLIISEARQTGTVVAVFEGTEGVESAVISIFSKGRYLLERWRRQPSKFGTLESKEGGIASQDKGTYLLRADNGYVRTLRPASEGLLQCVEDEIAEEYRHRSIAGWHFRKLDSMARVRLFFQLVGFRLKEKGPNR